MTKALIESIFGTYEPVQYTHYWYDDTYNVVESADIIPSGAAGVDWPYVLGVLAFLVVLYCVLRIIGSVINRV